MNEQNDLFADIPEALEKCPVCLVGAGHLRDVSYSLDWPPMFAVMSYVCDRCGWSCAGYVKKDNYLAILSRRWNNPNKYIIESVRLKLGISLNDDLTRPTNALE
ncbi:hypothetical protein GO003_019015 [Methylicorpusculum oleiharenae]|uniref:hypothetical protein n=1 Tax=Methylicorpusculum oleiharenae TaxID=1338687 RepID=UPI0013569D04|nr:hypothetical protein [Methylicorpusculum oleiharenae]MCD2452479.1 hypothetical protein [Methylicorpusculum oleiharenae]